MAVSFQEQSRKRKLIYAVLVGTLLSVAMMHREWLLNPLSMKIGIRQEQQGAVELTGSALRLSLTGSRGLAVCVLWWTAIEKQKKHEWNKLANLVRSVTKLQPHFITPWLFQSWNLSYNVSVESDRIKDKYFYITQGMELLADGERKNRAKILEPDGSERILNHPELCFNLGFYYQQKIGTHDNQNTLLSLLQMSAIDPRQRDPNSLRKLDASLRPVVDLERFAKFCDDYPILVRRLREVLRYETPEEVVEFLGSNQKLPTRFEEDAAPAGAAELVGSRLKPPDDQFPVLAPLSDSERQSDDSPDAPDFSTFTAARGWFAYSQRPLPETDPTFVTEIKDTYKKERYRMPKAMAHLIFRGYPARAQDYVASHLQREGWFDKDGWRITGWFPDSATRTVGQGRQWSEDAWTRAYNLYQAFGDRTGLYVDPATMANLEQEAQPYRKAMNLSADHSPSLEPLKDDPMRGSFEAHLRLFWYDRFRSMTNFPHFFHKTFVEQRKETIQGRKAFFEAERLRRAGQSLRALERYAEAIPQWRALLRAHKEFRRDQFIQEETYETQIRFMNLARGDRRPLKELKLGTPQSEDWRSPAVRNLLIVQEMLAKAGTPAGLVPVHLAEIGPFDWIDDPSAADAQPLISDAARAAVNSRR